MATVSTITKACGQMGLNKHFVVLEYSIADSAKEEGGRSDHTCTVCEPNTPKEVYTKESEEQFMTGWSMIHLAEGYLQCYTG